MKKKRKKMKNGIAKALTNPAFHQRVKPDKRKSDNAEHYKCLQKIAKGYFSIPAHERDKM